MKKCHCCAGTGEESNDVKIGRELRAMRLAARVQHKAMARELGVSPPMLAFLEKGQRRWKPEWIARFKAVLLFTP